MPFYFSNLILQFAYNENGFLLCEHNKVIVN